MSTYRYNKEDNTISPVVYMPDVTLSDDFAFQNDEKRERAEKYNKLIHTRIPVSGKHKWRDGQELQEGKDLRVTYSINNLRDKIAVPIDKPVDQEADQPDWKEKAKKEIYTLLFNDKSKRFSKITQHIIQWIEDNKHLIK